ncbi:MAG: glycosyltransferase [Nanoarchaeota archaeon]|nr:glycosyltransferase [Nanoarchaeota archaeon]
MEISNILKRKGKLKNLLLHDTTLCAIVRDEMINPAGGIEDFIESTVPFVEEAIVLDTGSVDGTKGKLKELRGNHSNLKVMHHEFEGYSKSRNRSMEPTKTRYILVLDADERLEKKDFMEINDTLDLYSEKEMTLSFFFTQVYPNLILRNTRDGHKIRLFSKELEPIFKKDIWEYVEFQKRKDNSYFNYTSINIKHFLPEKSEYRLKEREWYDPLESQGELTKFTKSPAECPSFLKWKQPNPQREKYRD